MKTNNLVKILGIATALGLGMGCGPTDDLPPGVSILDSQLSAPVLENDTWVRTGYVGTQVEQQAPRYSDTYLSEPMMKGMSGDARLLVMDRGTKVVTTFAISDAKATCSIAGAGGAVQIGMPADGSFIVNGKAYRTPEDAARELFKHSAFLGMSVADLTAAQRTMTLLGEAPAPTSKKAVGRAIVKVVQWILDKGIRVKVGRTF